MRLSAASHVGLVRERNEDDFCVWEGDGAGRPVLLAVADGMGGYRAGEVASALALATIRSHVERALLDARARGGMGAVAAGGEEAAAEAPADPCDLLAEGIRAANRRVYHRARRSPDLRGMGTTVTALLVLGRDLFVGHVGDSRAYLLRGDEISQLTVDHSLVGEMMHRGDLTEQEARRHPQRHILTRALGVTRSMDIDTGRARLAAGDVLVLATDGLTNAVSAREMLAVVRSRRHDFGVLAPRLVALANERGGRDNATVIVAEV